MFKLLSTFANENYFIEDLKKIKTKEAVVQRCSVKKVFLEISQNSLENTCARVSFLKKRLSHRCFPVNFLKFLKTPFFIEHLWWLLLKLNVGRLSKNDNL